MDGWMDGWMDGTTGKEPFFFVETFQFNIAI
jgi:hypothetical protein